MRALLRSPPARMARATAPPASVHEERRTDGAPSSTAGAAAAPLPLAAALVKVEQANPLSAADSDHLARLLH